MEHPASRLAIHDPELGLIVVNRYAGGAVHYGASDGWKQSPEVAGLLDQMRGQA